MPICPFCHRNEPNTRDHIFPDFLGGHQKVDACNCNNTFGHQFEARVNQNLQPIFVMLAKNGLQLKRPAIWQNAYTDPETGWEYNLSDDSHGILTKPIINKNKTGKIESIIYRSKNEVKKLTRQLKKSGKQLKFSEKVTQVKTADITFNTITVKFDTEIRRLCVKMCIGLLSHMGEPSTIVAENARNYLLGNPVDIVPVRFSNIDYHSLDHLRHPLAHLIYIEGNNSNEKLFGIVQFFGAIQFYIVLNNEYKGESLAYLGMLDVEQDKETFNKIKPLDLEESPPFISLVESAQSGKNLIAKINNQVHQLFGTNNFIIKPGNDYTAIFSPKKDIFVPLMLGFSGVSLNHLSARSSNNNYEFINLMNVLAENDIEIGIEGSKVLISAQIIDRKGQLIIEISRNKISTYSDKLITQKHETDDTFEMVDSNGRLLIQVLVDTSSIHFQGIISSKTGWAIGLYEYQNEVTIHIFRPEDEIPEKIGEPMFNYSV